jgi:hypothetical protein
MLSDAAFCVKRFERDYAAARRRRRHLSQAAAARCGTICAQKKADRQTFTLKNTTEKRIKK